MSGPESFELGRVVATPGALALVGRTAVYALLDRHRAGDWGDLDSFDRAENTRALEVGDRIFSAYVTPAGKLYVITEADRSSTCLLLPEKY